MVRENVEHVLRVSPTYTSQSARFDIFSIAYTVNTIVLLVVSEVVGFARKAVGVLE